MQYLKDQAEVEAIDWMEQAAEWGRKALCQNRKCGTVIVKDSEIIGAGYNAPPLDKEEYRKCNQDLGPGKPNFDKTCCMHAEWRAIIDAMKRNPEKLNGSTLYFTSVDEAGTIKKSGEPSCTVCSRMALDAGIETFVLWQEAGMAAYPTPEYDKVSYEYVLNEKDKEKYRNLRL